jgi:hypothetical protein
MSRRSYLVGVVPKQLPSLASDSEVRFVAAAGPPVPANFKEVFSPCYINSKLASRRLKRALQRTTREWADARLGLRFQIKRYDFSLHCDCFSSQS